MTSIGLDVGTGFVKCVSDIAVSRFPSLYAYRQPSSWEDRKGLVEAVGYEAVNLARHPDAVLIRPVMLGRPINERAFGELARKAIGDVIPKKGAVGEPSNLKLDIAVGLPYDARGERQSVRRLISRLYETNSCNVGLQVLGTLVDVDLKDALVVSLGHGTTEIVAFQNRVPVKGVSVHNAASDICERLGVSKISYLDSNIFCTAKARQYVTMLVDAIMDDLNSISKDLSELPVIVSGGGILIPHVKETIESHLGRKIIMPQDPVKSNANGLYKLASLAC